MTAARGLRRSLVAVVVALSAVGAGAGCAAGPGPTVQPTSTTLAGPPPPLPAASADALARLVRDYGGGATHATVDYAFGTRHQALLVLGMGTLPPNQVDSEVFVTVVRGSFALPGARVPKGAPTPQGGYLVVTFDRNAPAGPLDVAVSQTEPALARVGQVAETTISSASPAPGSPAPPS